MGEEMGPQTPGDPSGQEETFPLVFEPDTVLLPRMNEASLPGQSFLRPVLGKAEAVALVQDTAGRALLDRDSHCSHRVRSQGRLARRGTPGGCLQLCAALGVPGSRVGWQPQTWPSDDFSFLI